MHGDLYYPMSRKKLGHAVIINNLDREQIPTQRSEFFGQKIKYNIQYRDVSSMATVLQDIGKFRKQTNSEKTQIASDLLELIPLTNSRF